MKIITVPHQARAINALLDRARQENLILRTPDGKEFVLAEIDDLEIELTRQNEELMRLLESRAKQTQTAPLAQVKEQLGLA